MDTTSGSFDEFWATSRPFFERIRRDPQIANSHANAAHHAAIARAREAQESINQQMRATDAHLDRVASMVATAAATVAKQAEEIESYERRLGHLEDRPD